MGCLALILPIIIVLPLVLILLFFDVIAISFSKLGLSAESAVVLLIFTLVGSMVNIPVSHRKIPYQQQPPSHFHFFFFQPPAVTTQTVAVNVGGAIIPAALALYLLPRAAPLATLVTTAVVALTAWKLSRIVPGVGIAMSPWIPPIISAGLAFLLARDNPAPVAYIAGTMGTLIGADLLNWRKFKQLGPQLISIGGAGVFDGIFLSGLIATLLT